MERIELIVKENKRIDAIIASELADVSRSYVQKIIEDGCVYVNDKEVTSKKLKLKVDDVIVINMPEPEKLEVLAEDIPIDIVYEDDDLMIINKPVGMVVHPAPGNYTGTLVNALMFHSEKLSSINGVIRPGIVHRIDKDTSGLLMIAKTDQAHQSLADQLKEHSITRKYVAIVHGCISSETGTVKAPIGRSPKDRLKMAVNERNGKEATTHFRVIKRFKNYTYIECQLETGRTHQIRVHMAYIGHPLLGDPVYGVKKPKIKHEGQLLHAKTLGFVHPSTGEEVLFDSEVPEIFETMFKKIKGVEGGPHAI
ncbi:RluA family pseudouridine synthase [Acidaminobacter sp. JC074]|uniref:RluA family pseudouridine synthase n=1 Tax=Acidaminobacter sp. JC074 TaxID=2530199 RepID=UPI001F10168B|nr:RluA family pseudouridine synthase [Acidaminobacter sp. JC074]MCH4890238.1 RluA family pseudouridine synthase [Acidaminobacter sp. JC074]